MIVIDVGNTNIVIGFYTKNKLIKIIRLKTQKKINITKKEINKFFKSNKKLINNLKDRFCICLLYTSPSPRDLSTSRMPSSA